MSSYLPHVLQSYLIKEIHSNALHDSEQIYKLEINKIVDTSDLCLCRNVIDYSLNV